MKGSGGADKTGHIEQLNTSMLCHEKVDEKKKYYFKPPYLTSFINLQLYLTIHLRQS